jgi:tetratricopeptide (TPR) repeat protein
VQQNATAASRAVSIPAQAVAEQPASVRAADTDAQDMPPGWREPANDSYGDTVATRPESDRARAAETISLTQRRRRQRQLLLGALAVLPIILVGWFVARSASAPDAKLSSSAAEQLAVPAAAGPSEPIEPALSTQPAPTMPDGLAPPSAAPAVSSPTRSSKRSARDSTASQPKAAPASPSALELSQAAQHELIQGHLAAAADLYARATRVDSRNEAAWRGLGLANERLGRTAEAIRALRRAIQLSPNGQYADMLRARLQKLVAGSEQE